MRRSFVVLTVVAVACVGSLIMSRSLAASEDIQSELESAGWRAVADIQEALAAAAEAEEEKAAAEAEAGATSVLRAAEAGAASAQLAAEAVGREGEELGDRLGTKTLDGLRAPDSPAFTLLGVETTSVARPNTPKAFAATLASAFGDGTTIPKNYALEFSPYRILMKGAASDLSLSEYGKRGGARGPLRNLSVSFATSTTAETNEASSQTRASLGFRTLLFDSRTAPSGLTKAHATMAAAGELLRQRIGARKADIAGQMVALATRKEKVAQDRQALRLRLCKLLESSGDSTDDAADNIMADSLTLQTRIGEAVQGQRMLAQATAELDAAEVALRTLLDQGKIRLAAAAAELDAASEKREGFVVAIAGGWSWQFDEQNFEGGERTGRGLWITPTWQQPNMELLGVGRMLRHGVGELTDTTWDLGGRFLIHSDRISASVEAVWRYGREDPTNTQDTLKATTRVAGLIEYEMSPGQYLRASFGKDFDEGEAAGRNLISTLGVQFNFGKNPILKAGGEDGPSGKATEGSNAG
ncbi:hypothetical protein HN371_24690 [Candidatus Poribacteria bacterium]|nr:hypothetical protein [Candidatus Poribacteria bacterium]MBT5714266.1 hypothetical protein [Candidatus Poribacteria bacterium]MBT7096153.1 hypothetical protein [Candidatus Poribacteria bacterium]MBT7807203.1 hypothetical protein [Candidatus Poribacteria bacterium]